MPKDHVINGTGAARNSSIRAYLRNRGNISSTVKHRKNDIYKVLLDFDESEEAAEALEHGGAIILERSRRKLIITFTPHVEYIGKFENGGLQVPPEILDAFKFKEGSLIEWRVEHFDGISRVSIRAKDNV